MIVFMLANDLHAQESQEPDIYLYDLHLKDWGLKTVEEIHQGQFALVHDATEEYLELHALYPVLLPEPEEKAAVVSHVPAYVGNRFQVTLDAKTNLNNLGGRCAAFQRSPSSSQAQLDGDALTLSYKKEPDGFCGLWIHLFNSSAPPEKRVYLDARPFPILSFQIRGRQGGETCSLRMADARWIEKEDSVLLGDVASFLPSGGVGREWNRAIVPLDQIPSSLKRNALGSLVFSIEKPGAGSIDIKDIQLQTESPAPKEPKPLPVASKEKRTLQRAVWIWNTSEIVKSATERENLIRFLTERKIGRLFLQNPTQFYQKWTKKTFASLGSYRYLISTLKKNVMEVYALDGGPDYALPENHDKALAVLSNVIQYNQKVPPEERVSGVHYDIEAHVLAGFGGVRRLDYLASLLALYEKMTARLKGTGIALGVDIPFWLDSPDELTGRPTAIVFKGENKNVAAHVLDRVDYAVIMDYRTKVEEADGIVANAESELQYASNLGKPVFIGVETRPVPDQTLYRFSGSPSPGAPATFPPNGVWIVDSQPKATRTALFTSPQSFQKIGQIFTGASTNLFFLPIEARIQTPGAKISFASKGLRYMEEVIGKVESQLRSYPSFAGFAIHDYSNYKRLCENPEGK